MSIPKEKGQKMKKRVKVVAESGMSFFATVHNGIGMVTMVIKENTIVKRSGGGFRGYVSRKDIPEGFSQFHGRGDFLKMERAK